MSDDMLKEPFQPRIIRLAAADAEPMDKEDRALFGDLVALGQADAGPRFYHSLHQRLEAETAALVAGRPVVVASPSMLNGRRHSRQWSRRVRQGVASVAAAMLLATGGMAAYFHGSSPTPASAEVVLRHVAAALPESNGDQVVHAVQVTAHDGILGQSTVVRETWTQLNASGSVVKEALSETSSSGVLLRRFVLEGNQLHSYDGSDNLVENRSLPPDEARSIEQDQYGVAEMRQIIQSAQAGAAHDVQLLPQQTLDGATVDVVKVPIREKKADQTSPTVSTSDSPYSLLYVDPQSYKVRGIDAYSIDARGTAQMNESMRVTVDETVPLSGVPAAAFAFTSPAGARVAIQAPDCMVIPVLLPITVAQAVAEQAVPALLMASDVGGLQLQRIERMQVAQDTTKGLKGTTVAYTYRTQTGATFTVQLRSDGPSGPAAVAAQPRLQTRTVTTRGSDGQIITTNVRPVTLNLGGKQVEASYDQTIGDANDSQLLTYDDTTSGLAVVIEGEKLSSEDFFAAVAGLTDARTQQAIVSRAAQELAAAPPPAPVAPAKAYCGDGVG